MSLAVNRRGLAPIPPISEVQELDFCFCGVDCADEYTEKALVSASADEYENDKSSFLFRKLVETDAIALEIWKGGVKQADIIDNSFGSYYDSFTSQPLYVGVVIDWKAVFTAFGYGYYTIRAERTQFGVSVPFTSRNFNVLPYSPELANGTARIETFTTGNILRSEFDYMDLVEGGWYQSIRIKGEFGKKTPTYVSDSLLNSQRQVLQVQPSIEFDYVLSTDFLPQAIRSIIINDQMLNNNMLISDYNLLSDAIYKQVPLVLEAFEDTSFAGRETGYTIKFKDRVQNQILRNR
ncbi:hypothetical protein N9878_02515 [bacterium]|nr:hypothetical protein [bacterium]